MMKQRQTSYPQGKTMLDEPERHGVSHYILKHWLKENQHWKSYKFHLSCKRPDCVVHA